MYKKIKEGKNDVWFEFRCHRAICNRLWFQNVSCSYSSKFICQAVSLLFILCQLLISLRTIFMLISGLFKNVIIISIFIIHFHYSFWSTIMMFIFWYFDFHIIQWWDLLLNCYSLHSLAHFVTSWHFVKLSKVDASPEILYLCSIWRWPDWKLDKHLINDCLCLGYCKKFICQLICCLSCFLSVLHLINNLCL